MEDMQLNSTLSSPENQSNILYKTNDSSSLEINILSEEIDKMIDTLSMNENCFISKKLSIDKAEDLATNAISLEHHQKLKGTYCSITKSQEQSRELQLMLPNTSSNIAQEIFREIKNNFVELFLHIYSNYFTHKLFYLLSDEDKREYLTLIINNFSFISCDKVGTFAIQRVLDILSKNEKILFIDLYDKKVNENELIKCCNVSSLIIIIIFRMRMVVELLKRCWIYLRKSILNH